MARRDEAAQHCREGLSPSAIAVAMGVSPGTVAQYLNERVGAGVLERSDLLIAALPESARRLVESDLRESEDQLDVSEIAEWLSGEGIEVDQFDLRFYLQHRGRSFYLGDLFRYMADIEVALHQYVETELREAFSDRWWREGVPLEIRQECVGRREEDPDPSEPWDYSTFIHLRTVFEKQWSVLSRRLPKQARQNRKAFLTRLVKANQIRNRVMHPIRFTVPTEDDLEFVRELHADLQFPRRAAREPGPGEPVELSALGAALMEALRAAGREAS